jgi:hypothetical protein
MSAARPTEIKTIAALLAGGGESPEELAKAVIDKLDEIRTDRAWFTVLSVMDNKWAIGFGPYTTDNKAREALSKGRIPTASLARINTVIKTYSPRHAAQSLEGLDQ